jgi:phage gp36-like protein
MPTYLFLVKNDYLTSIKTATLDGLTGSNDGLLNEISKDAVEEMKGYLNARYDVAHIFDVPVDPRHRTILMYCKDIAIYHLYSMNTAIPMPEIRATRYHAAINWLEQVCQQKINPEGLPFNTKSFVKTGGNELRINHQE